MRRIESTLLYFGAAALLVMMLHTVADVTSRTLLNRPIEGTYEATVYWYMVLLTGLGLWAAEVKRDHIAVTLVTDRMDTAGRFVHLVLTRGVTIAFLMVMAWYGMQSALNATSSGEFTGAAEIIIWPTRYFLPVGMLAYATVLILRLIRQVRTGRLDDEPSLEEEVVSQP